MSTVSAPLVEAYVMKKMHKEKMKRMEKVEAGRDPDQKEAQKIKKSSGGLFSGMFKKVHPSAAVPSSESAVQS